MKHVRRIIVCLLIILGLAVFVNAKTGFFRDIGTYIPYIDAHYPYVADFISELSNKVNEKVSKIPTPSEIYAKLRHVDIPIDPDDVAANSYYLSDTMLNFYNHQNFSVDVVNSSELDVYGVLATGDDKFLVYRFIDSEGNLLEQFSDSVDSDGNYRKIMSIPDGSAQFTLFTGPERFGNFTSQFYDYVYLTQSDDGSWSVKDSPVYEHNLAEYTKDKSLSVALKSTYSVCSDSDSVRALAQSITSGFDSAYDKAAALHDWVCKNIYYDSDSIIGDVNSAPYIATDVLSQKKAVCLGYANLYAALCRSIEIPCNVVIGYALGVVGSDDATSWSAENINTTESNHAWNEVNIGDRWIIVDTTWDSKNKINGGEAVSEGEVSYLFFDANIKFFSANHKILEYVRR